MSSLDISPFQYNVRVSRRAKRVNLCIKPGTGLEVVVPLRFDHSQIDTILRSNQTWIERNLEKFGQAEELAQPASPPDSLNLIGLNKQFHISYTFHKGCVSQVEEIDHHLAFTVNPAQRQDIHDLLIVYLKSLAKFELLPLLEQLAYVNKLSFNRLTIRGQKTRWGSCSSKGNINLNFKLLFLPPELLRYVLLHELAHTLHLNHSPKFWASLEKICPNALVLDEQLKLGGQYVPAWVDQGIA